MDQDLKEIFLKASKIVESLPEVLKPKAFELAVEQLKKQAQDIQLPRSDSKNIPDQDFFDRLSIFVEIKQEYLKAVYKIDKNSTLLLIAPINGKPSDVQRKITLLYLLGSKIGLEKEWVSTLDLVKQIEIYGVKDKNLSRNLRVQKGILQSGKKHGKEYGLSPTGIILAKELLKVFSQ